MKIDKYSKLLAIISANNLLDAKEIKFVIKHCIRTVTETWDYHGSVDYRSEEVEQETQRLKGKNYHLTDKSNYHKFCRKHFRHEHIVPCEVQYKLLMGLSDLSEGNIKEFLNKHSLRATITKEQDKKLNELGFRSKMPNWFYTKTEGYEEYFENPRARYLESDIRLKEFKNA